MPYCYQEICTVLYNVAFYEYTTLFNSFLFFKLKKFIEI